MIMLVESRVMIFVIMHIDGVKFSFKLGGMIQKSFAFIVVS